MYKAYVSLYSELSKYFSIAQSTLLDNLARLILDALENKD